MRFTLKDSNRLLAAISQAQALYINGHEPDNAMYQHLLDSFLDLTGSERGIIGQVHWRTDGRPYFKPQACTDVDWNEDSGAMEQQQGDSQLKTNRFDTLLGAVMTTGKPVIANEPDPDSRSSGRPPGRADLPALMGLPVHISGTLVGLVGMASRKQGYHHDLAEFLQPLLNTCGLLINITASGREWLRMQSKLELQRDQLEMLVKERTTELQQQQWMLERILDHLPVALWVKDVNNDFRHTIYNKAAEELYSYPAAQVLGHSEFDFMEPGEALRIRQEDIELASSNLIIDIPESRFTSMTGEIKFARKMKLAIPDADGKPSLILGLCEDLTEQKWAEQAMRASEIRFRELAEHAPVGIFMTDPRGASVYINEHLRKMTGLDQELAAGNGWIAAVHEEDRPKLVTGWQDFILGTSNFNREFRFTHPDEHVIWVSGTAVRLKNESGQIIGFLGCVTDISLAKQHEIELRLSKNEAERANSAKTEFLSRMSHELRTPLNAVLGFAQLLQLNNENLTQSQKEGVIHILNGGENLLHLIEDVLDFARIESGHTSLNLQRFPLDQVLRRSLSLIRSLAEQRGATIISSTNEPVSLFADLRLTQQILVNLLSNAIKYNNTGGTVEISAFTLPDNMVRISIKDSGIGIRPEDQTRLFEPFERVADPNHMIEGTGIGLSICKKLVQSMSGRIGFESEFGIGSTFWFELPAATATAMAESPTNELNVAALTSKLAGVRILYVEDHLASISLMTELARQIPDCEFTAASNAFDGLSLAKSSRPDLILMDINLPGLGGFDALALLRKDERTRDIPVIALSASASTELIESGNQAGFALYLAKPLKLDKLLQTLAATHKPAV